MSTDNTKVIDATDVAKLGYSELIKYTSKTRSFPHMRDGLKAVYRRILYASRPYTKVTKALAIVGDTLKYHEHGDASVAGALMNMGPYSSSTPILDTRGNWGGLDTSPSAPRYLRCGLSEFGRLLIGDELIDYAEYDDDHEYPSPVALPMYLPYALIEGDYSMTTGMPNPRIPKLNKIQLIDFYLDYLQGNDLKYPDIDEGDVIIHVQYEGQDKEMLKNSVGPIWYKGIVQQEGPDTVVVTNFPPSRNFERLMKKLRFYLDSDAIYMNDVSEDTEWRLVFTVENPRAITVEKLKSIIEHELSSKVTYNMLFEMDGVVYESSLLDVVDANLKYLRECIVRKYTDQLQKSSERMDVLEAIQVLRAEQKLLSRISVVESSEIIEFLESKGFSSKTSKSVISRPISFLTKSHDSEIQELRDMMTTYEMYRDTPDVYLIDKYEVIRSEVEKFERGRIYSTVTTDPDSVTFMTNGKVVNHEYIEVTYRGRNKNISWNSSIYAHTDEGLPYIYYPNMRSNGVIDSELVGLSETKISGFTTDKDKYVIYVEGDDSIVVRETSDLFDGRSMITRDGSVELRVLGSEVDKVEFVGVDGDTLSIDLKEYVRSRRSRTYSLGMKSRIKEIKE